MINHDVPEPMMNIDIFWLSLTGAYDWRKLYSCSSQLLKRVQIL